MFDVGAIEMFVIAVLAIVVVGPKDLPKVVSSVGKMIGRMRALAGDFKHNLDVMAREAELDELRQTVDSARTLANPKKLVKDLIDPDGDLEQLTIGPEAFAAPVVEDEPSKTDDAGPAKKKDPGEGDA